MPDKKIGALIPIRLASSRLPNKAIREICGKPAVCHLLDRVFASKYVKPRDAVVCTTTRQSDDALIEIVENYGASVFRGSEDDIIDRFYQAMKVRGFNAVIQVDGDDILCATEYMDLTIEKLLSDSTLDIATCKGLPLGIASKSFTWKAMEKVYQHYRTVQNDTGFIYFFTKTSLCKQAVIEAVSESHRLDDARLTLDYEEDFEVFRRIIEALYKNGKIFSLSDVIAFLKKNPEIMSINGSLAEQYWQRTREKAQLSYVTNEGKTVRVEV